VEGMPTDPLSPRRRGADAIDLSVELIRLWWAAPYPLITSVGVPIIRFVLLRMQPYGS